MSECLTKLYANGPTKSTTAGVAQGFVCGQGLQNNAEQIVNKSWQDEAGFRRYPER